uniref:Uncharacterized protein n=1 Tax=Candidatus Kentrum sp. TUN TaxID=2126343 RepID=A0A450ZF47_9GAMM|nr:MAG: hypothetical protein BECKTUN1418F_GA0071002_100822 [Candidatus Kentron sp. TUN]VFK52931.1 MAG: hypothetical protein BECKTUN1418E_GA0071001_101122 [Candidatus Kentron sp. TUN]VFK57584.1 MAG: hypothetical protein BECKTUN1418D_GA0071000_106516 [Candidatus Kentron sp. TUN]
MTITFHSPMNDLVKNRTSQREHKSQKTLSKKDLDIKLAEGLADVKAGRYRELTSDTIGTVAKSIVKKSLQ